MCFRLVKHMVHTLDYKTPPKYSDYRARHNKNYASSLIISESDFENLSAQTCFYCGVAGPNGIDRRDSSKGYEKDNCVSCCKHCNYVKGNLSTSDFEEWTIRFVRYQSEIRTAQ